MLFTAAGLGMVTELQAEAFGCNKVLEDALVNQGAL